MAGVFASMAIEWAIDKLYSLLPACLVSTPASSSSSAAPAESEDLEVLKRLERTMHRIHATLHDAEEQWNIREETAKLRLKELKKVAYDAEDVVDEYGYEMTRHKVEAFEQSARANRSGKRRREEVKFSSLHNLCQQKFYQIFIYDVWTMFMHDMLFLLCTFI
jgi:hypothetical protein